MADNKKNVPEVENPGEAPVKADLPAPDKPGPEPVLTEEEAAILTHEGQAALFEMGEFIPDPGDKGIPPMAAPAVDTPPKEAPTAGKVVDFAAARDETEKTKAPTKDAPAPDKADKKAAKTQEADKPRRGRPAKADKAAPDKADPPKRDKMSQSKKTAAKTVPTKEEAAPAPAEPEQPPAPRDATRSTEPEQIVYLNLSELHAFKDHPFGVRDDAEMRSLVESVKAGGVNQPALVRPREEGGYEIIAGHRRQKASELAGYVNMPCIVRNMTDDEAILAMTDDNLRQRSEILLTEKAQSLKMQVEAIKHQGGPGLGEDAGKRSTEIVGERNGINYKQVQRYIAVSIEGQQSTPSLSQAQQLRKLDKEGKLNPDVIDGILSQEKKKEDRNVIINGAELEKYFGKEATPRQMKDQIMALLDDWKAKKPPELGKSEKKTDKSL